MPNVWYNNITYIKEGAHMEKRPAWIEKYKRKGTVIQRNGDVYSLYSSKSHREPGKRCPVVERKYIGTVTPDGLVVKTDVNVDNSGIRVYEFGFTYALTKLLPERLGACRMDEDEKLRLFKFLILRNSPGSYAGLWTGIGEWGKADDASRVSLYERRLFNLAGVPDIQGLERLKSIYLLDFGAMKVRSAVSGSQRDEIRKLGLEAAWDLERESDWLRGPTIS
jgi:hypothetical protein